MIATELPQHSTHQSGEYGAMPDFSNFDNAAVDDGYGRVSAVQNTEAYGQSLLFSNME
jgi:hypothetical protein